MRRYEVLDQMESPEGVRALNEEQLCALCAELRYFLVESVSRTGGHLASNLGVVELTVALHRVFHSPVDQIVWDVGHQCYIHKILTGRRKEFSTLRQQGGVSGFPKTKESPHDAFIAGHASTAVAVADGIARAKRLRGEKGHVIAVIGDGALTGGMAYEGILNAARSENKNLIVILNDNKMSISRNASSMGAYLARMRSNRAYFQVKDLTKSALRAIPGLGESVVEVVANSKSLLKEALFGSSFFEDLGFAYLGPADGHNLGQVCALLERARSLGRPALIHLETVKGRGYDLAEQNPGRYHGVSKFDPRTGSEALMPTDNFSDVFGRYLTFLAEKDKRICAVTAAMKYGTGLNHFKRRLGATGRFVDVGIAEQHAVTFSAALASKGMLPVCAVYSTFLQRAYDQILHDCAIEPRRVVLAVDRAGLVGEDGETHQGAFDCAFLPTIPGMTIYSPATYRELRRCLHRALYKEEGVVAVRYPRGAQPALQDRYQAEHGDYLHLPGRGLLIATYGREWAQAVEAAESLRADGRDPGLLKLTKVFPLAEDAIEIAGGYDEVLFVEEGVRFGGIGERFAAALSERGFPARCRVRAVEGFVAHATVQQQLCACGLDARSLAEFVRREIPGKEQP